MYDFNRNANRLMKADYQEYNAILSKFFVFIERAPVIWEYIHDCGKVTFDIAAEIAQVSLGRSRFELGDTSEQENANIYHILRYSVDNKINVVQTIARSYSHSQKWQDMIKDFNERVVFVLISNIEGHLTKIGIDMGIDDTTRHTITVNNGQINLASDNAVINATINNGINQAELKVLLDKVIAESKMDLSDNDQVAVQKTIAVVEQELSQDNPKKTVLRNILAGLQAIKGSVEFCAAVVDLMQFVQSLIG
jgi:hypothetical protein